MSIKIMEWNINQRLNYSRKDMPKWIAEVISKTNADLIALVEVYKGNNWEDVKKAAFNSNYAVFETSNKYANQNEVVIAVNVSKLDVLHAKTYFPDKNGIPDYLEVKCRDKKSKKEFTFIGARIHASVNDEIKMKEFLHILNVSENNDTVIICGDFNNNRRGFSEDGRWHLTKIDEMIKPFNFSRKTPDGASIYQEKCNNIDYEFAEDHFFLKGIDQESFTLPPYDRSFVAYDKSIYKWGSDFQIYLGRDDFGKNLYQSIPAPFPDHAILTCELEIK